MLFSAQIDWTIGLLGAYYFFHFGVRWFKLVIITHLKMIVVGSNNQI